MDENTTLGMAISQKEKARYAEKRGLALSTDNYVQQTSAANSQPYSASTFSPINKVASNVASRGDVLTSNSLKSEKIKEKKD